MTRRRFDVYSFLTDALMHCMYGPGGWQSAEAEERKNDAGDQEAAGILTDLRSQIARERLDS